MSMSATADRDPNYQEGHRTAYATYAGSNMPEHMLLSMIYTWKAKAGTCMDDSDIFEYSWGFVDGVTDVIRKRRNGGFDASNYLS